MTLLYYKFQIFSSPQLLPPLPHLTEIWEMLTISNYYRPPNSDLNLKCQPLAYLTHFPPAAIRILSIYFPDLSPNSDGTYKVI